MGTMLRDPKARAFVLLSRIMDEGRTLEEALSADPVLATFDERDRAYTRLLVLTALRRLGQLDAAIDAYLRRPIAARKLMVRHVLRLGMAQILFLGTPSYAAVDTSVKLSRRIGQGEMAGLVNAILRRASRDRESLLEDPGAARRNTPDWLWKAWTSTYGEETARAIADAHLKEPPLDLTVREDPAGWAVRLDGEHVMLDTVRCPNRGPVSELPGFREGGWWVQDLAAALPAHLMGEVGGKRVIDLCAAPGGKTMQLAAAGAHVTAVDISSRRLDLLKDNLSRVGLGAELVLSDAAEYRPPQPADMVLLDAPCSATGTIRRNPDVARLKRPEDITRMSGIQERLLAAAAGLLAPGGILVYAVCSLEPMECGERIRALLAHAPGLERAPIGQDEIPGLRQAITPEGELRTLPCHLSEAGGMDGFYACRLRSGDG
ncbi:MAG: RsmB/NOP family class I SAM-dependent RNA methyltransferase [Alphaproteobacteria bacterium]